VHYEITQRGNYLRGVIGDTASTQEFASFYLELQTRSTALGFDRALVVVRPEREVAGTERLVMFQAAGFIGGFKLALVCATWTLYQSCNNAETAADRVAVNVRAFLQEMEAVSWLTASS
jgi:hypothetical protein